MKMMKKTTQIQVRRTQNSLKKKAFRKDPLTEKRADLDPSQDLEGPQVTDETAPLNPETNELLLDRLNKIADTVNPVT